MLVLGLFLVALLPRVLTLAQFITSDEPLWATRSMAFLTGLLTTDWRATLQTGHPGVTTMWTGSLGLVLDYVLNHREVGTLLAFIQGLPDDYRRIDPTILPWMRLPTGFLTALSVAAVYLLLRSVNRNVALISALLLAFDSLYLAHSRVLHHDALVSVFSSLAILSVLIALYRWSWKGLIFSGVMGGLALLSKSSAYTLVPFIGVTISVEVVARRVSWRRAVLGGLLWGLASLATVVVLWPAIWVAPGDVWQAIFGWVLESADVGSVTQTVSLHWDSRVPDLGVLFYPVNWLLRTTPLMLLGLLFLPVWWRKEPKGSTARWWVLRLLGWVVLFSLVLTLGDKRDGRYLLPAYFALCVLAAFGLQAVHHLLRGVYPLALRLGRSSIDLYQAICVVLLLAFSLPYHPHYLAYYNPIVGGPWLAPRLVKVGWGEGMEKAAAWLNAQPNADQLVVATSYEQNFLPYFSGGVVKHHYDEPSDYVLNYVRQIQNGYPYPEYWQYYRVREPAYRLRLAWIEYVWLYQESSLRQVRNARFHGGLELMGFTLDNRLLQPGTTVEVTLVWRGADVVPSGAMAYVQLIDDKEMVWGDSPPAPVLDPSGPSPVEGHYQLSVLPNAPRFDGHLRVLIADADGQSLGQAVFGQVAVRSTSLPASAVPLPPVNLDNQISLLGYQVNATTLSPGQVVDVTLYWQAQTPLNFDYTVFVQLLAPDGGIRGQRDAQPANDQLPTSQWTVGEVVTDPHHFTVAPDAPHGDYRLLVGMYRWDTGERLPIVNDTTGQNAVMLSPIRVQTSD